MSSATNFLVATLVSEAGGEGAHGGGHEAHFDAVGIAAHWFNFLILVTVLVMVSRKPFLELLKTRREKLGAELAEAKKRQAEAERRLNEYSRKLENLESEVAGIIKNFEAQGEVDRERFRGETDRAIERLVRETDFTIKQESLKAQADIREAAVDATMRLAEALVKEKITDSDKRRLADDYVQQLSDRN